MAKIDVHGWKAFRIGDYFDAYRGKSRIQRGLIEGNMPLIAAARYNQGIAGAYCLDADYCNAITVSCNGAGCGSSYYHEGEFAITGDAAAVVSKHAITRNMGLFVAAIFDMWFTTHYSYQVKCGPDKILDTVLKLPVDASGEPDWDYMDEYMSQVMQDAEASLDAMQQADGDAKPIDVTSWKEFVIGDLFDVVKGTRLTKANMKPGNIRFIGSSAMNNGITATISNSTNLHPANTLTVCYNGSIGETFYQDEQFWASDDVNVLYPKFEMTRSIAMFIAPILKRVSARYMYTDKWKKETMEKDVIKLPVNASGEPDWDYMESYMSQVMQDADAALDNLASAN